MCGIAGIYFIDKNDNWQSVIDQIVKSQHYRGPDHRATECIPGEFASVIFGHNRLSIIDLSSNANQPMWDSEHRFCLTYNGEVYNYLELRQELLTLGHRFYTQSDSEVIIEAIKAWGIQAINRFNGMFAFGLFDVRTQTLWLVRDRFGVKPLFYYQGNRELLFASTGTFIAKHMKLPPNLDYVARGLRYWVYEDHTCISPYTGLNALPAGHYLRITTSETGHLDVQLQRYYSLFERVSVVHEQITSHSEKKLVDMVACQLEQAINLRLRSDVPLGVSLSGGLDSSSIAAIITKKHTDNIGFTFGNPDDPRSEGPLVKDLVRQIGIKIEYISPSISDIIQGFWDTLAAQDAPFAGGSIIAQHAVYRAAQAHGIKVLLGGQGGDELFMGYRKFQAFWLYQLMHERRYQEALWFALSMLPMLKSEVPRIGLFWTYRRRYIQGNLKSALKLPESTPLTIGYNPQQPVWTRQLQDITSISLPTLLRYEDRNSMGNSIESRLPFMDYQLVELALALPEVLKVRDGYGKWVIRQLMRGAIPEEIRSARYKRGFEINKASWIEQGLGQIIRSALCERMSIIQEWLETGTRIELAFSNQQLINRPGALEEAISLIWLGDRM